MALIEEEFDFNNEPSPLPTVEEEGDYILTVQEFRDFVTSGVLVDDDGVGSPVKDGVINYRVHIYPSKLDQIPESTTHIAWFSK